MRLPYRPTFGPASQATAVALTLAGIASIATSAAHAQDKAAKPGRVFGKVVDAADKPAPNVLIKLSKLARNNVGGGGKGRGGIKSIVGVPDPLRLIMLQVVVAQTKTDAEGKYEFKQVPPGTAIYDAGNPYTVGYTGGSFKVISDQAVEVNIKLEPPGRPGEN